MNSENPKTNWVAVRHRCTAKCELIQLFSLAEANVETRNEQIAQDSRPPLHVKPVGRHTQTGFVVEQPCRNEHFVGPRVRFDLDLESESIQIRGHELNTELALDVTVRLDDDGACALYVKDRRRERWQVLREALEELFFGLKSDDYT